MTTVPPGMAPPGETRWAGLLPERVVAAWPEPSHCYHPDCRMPVVRCVNDRGNQELFDLTTDPIDGLLVSHFAICKFADVFRRKR